MPKNIDVIQGWVNEHRPDLKVHLDSVLQGPAVSKSEEATLLLLNVGFEAGRLFQKSNPDAPDGPSAYL